MFRHLLHIVATLIAVLLLTPSVATAETRVALIIANSHYALGGNDLRNPAADARLIEAALRKAGFDKVTVMENLGREGMMGALKAFGNDADHADVALVYFAGHGVEIDHVNYLVPVDVAFVHDRDVETEAVSLDTMLRFTENAKRLRLVILDSCRENPYLTKMKKSSAGAFSKGLAVTEPDKNTLVVYSAKAGTVAYDGRVNSPFAESLAQRMGEPGVEINKVLRLVREDVLHKTGDAQEPIAYGTLSSQDFFFMPLAGGGRAVETVADLETESWALCRNAAGRGACESYLSTYPKGKYVALARTRLADFVKPVVVAAVAGEAARSAVVPAAALPVGDLGFTVRFDPGRKGLLVDSVAHNSRVEGQLIAGDLITKIDSAAPDMTQGPDTQLAANWVAEKRLHLLIMRDKIPIATTIK